MAKRTSFWRTPSMTCLPIRTVMATRKRGFKIFALFAFTIGCYSIFSLMPDAWKDADLVHVVRVITDSQNFHLEELNDARERQKILEDFFRDRPEYRDLHKGGDNVINIQKLLSELVLEPKEFYPEFFNEMKALTSVQSSMLEHSAKVLMTFQPILTQQEKSQLLTAFDIFSHICQEAGITYFLLEASLMGVRRHHGMIPWDDDIDIVVNASQWKTLYVLLSSIPGFEVYADSNVQWKFYLSTSTSFPDKPFKFPYLDIFFFREDADFIWAVTRGLKHDLVHKKSDIFPLKFRPFEGRSVPVPNNLLLLVDVSHDVSVCITGEYNHKTNTRFYYSGKVSVPCTFLANVYPFVHRKTDADGSVTETLKVGSRVLSTSTYKK